MVGEGVGGLGAGIGVLPGRRGVVGVYALLSLLVLVPIFSVRVPCLGDYLNHLARISILGKLGSAHLGNSGSSAALAAFYDTRWKFVPYYGMDIPVLLLSRVMGIYAAGRLFVAVCVVMPVAACMVLRRVVVGRVGLVPAIGFLFCYNYLLERGFLAYLFASALAVMLFAGWIGAAAWRRWVRAGVFSVGAVLLYLCHAYGFGVFCILVGGYEVGRAVRTRRVPGGWRAVARDWMAAAFVAVPTLVIGSALGGNDNFSPASFTHYGGLADKVGAVLSPVYFPGNAVVFTILIFLLVCAAVFGRGVRLAPVLHGPVIALAVAAVLAPSVLFNAWGSDFRLPLVLVVVVLAGVVPAGVERRSAGVALACVCGLVAWRSADAFVLLRAVDAQVASVRGVVAALPEGARLLVVEPEGLAPGRVAPAAMTGHIALVAAIDRDAFIPYLFLGNTTLRVRPAMERSSSFLSAPVDLAQLRDGMARRDPVEGAPGYGWGGHVYWWGWPAKFDYVLVDHFGAALPALPTMLRLVTKGAVADLYEVDHGGER